MSISPHDAKTVTEAPTDGPLAAETPRRVCLDVVLEDVDVYDTGTTLAAFSAITDVSVDTVARLSGVQ